jgi:hypothetical protein
MNIAQIGVGCHGLVHPEAIAELELCGLARLRAVADLFADQLTDVRNRLSAPNIFSGWSGRGKIATIL